MIKEVLNSNPDKLIDKLVFNGLTPSLTEHNAPEDSHIAPNTWITFPEGTDMTAVQAVIDAHDPTPLPPQPTDSEVLADLIQLLVDKEVIF